MDRDNQSVVGQWILSTGQIPDGYQEAHLSDEVAEFQHEFGNGRDPEKMRGELADIAIAVLGIAAAHEIDVMGAINEKMALVYIKYPPATMRELQEQGMTRKEAFTYMKELWEKNNVA